MTLRSHPSPLSMLPWLVAGACLVGCSSFSDAPDRLAPAAGPGPIESTSQALDTTDHTPVESASRPAAYAKPDLKGLVKLRRAEKLPLIIDAPEDELRGQDLHVFVSSLGFDGWSVRRPLTTWTVDGPSTTIEVDPFAFALRPVGSATEVRFEIEYTVDTEDHENPTQVIRIPSEPITLSYAPDDNEVYIGAQTQVVEVEVASALAAEGSAVDLPKVKKLVAAANAGPGSNRNKVLDLVGRALPNLVGQVTDSAGNSYPIGSAPKEGIVGSPQSRGEAGTGTPMITLPGSWITPRTVVPAPQPGAGDQSKLVFFSFATTSFRDSDFGEKALPGPNSTTAVFPSKGRAPMSYVTVRGFEVNGTRIDFDNGIDFKLNSAGFLPMPLLARVYALAFPHRNVGDATRNVEIFGFEGVQPIPGLVDIETLSLFDTDPVHVNMVRETPASRTAAVVGAMLTTPGLRVPANTRIFAGVGCPDKRTDAKDETTGLVVNAEACAASGVVYLGRNIRQDAAGKRFIAPGDTTEEKYVVGHELGHSIEHNTLGGPAGEVSQLPSFWDGELCGCAHVQGANSIHCLQSSENQAGGYLEGFAHFVATAIMNPQVTKKAPFVYYKEFLRPSSAPFGIPRRILPPVPVAAGTPVAWLRNRCVNGVQADRSTEYDWMTFLWGIYERETASAIDYPTWMGIVKDGFCGGGNCPNRAPLSWGPLRANAFVKFGSNPLEPRLQRMDKLGFDSSVDH